MSHLLTAFCRAILWLYFIFLFIPGKSFSQSCNNWLSLPSYQSYVSVGDLDVLGDKITVEATFMRTTPYSGGQIWAGDLVSKHVHPTDVNYLLRPNNAEITTTNGYFRTPEICEIELNNMYHAAMVYDGATLKFYRNGFLMSSVPAMGSMFQNDFQTRIGLYDALVHNTNLIGYINEVRIWNVARTQAQIRVYMNTSLPAPATQTGLLAYYTFDNLLNKQGNGSWNGVLGGAAAINRTISNCSFVPDSCALKPGNVVTPEFTFPDTVCVNEPVAISNTTVGATSYYWNFCVGSINKTPVGTNLGNIGGVLKMPVFIDYVYFNGNYYGFSTNYDPGGLIRLDFGNSLLNTPTAVNFGNFGGVIPRFTECIQVVQNEGRWYAIIVSGNTANGVTPRIIKVDFGPAVTNTTPVLTNWGNLGNMEQPIDLHVFQENGIWYGFTVNSENNTITRFNFTSSFTNIPTALNLGNIGNLAYPTGIYAINDNNFWRVFVVNGGNNSRNSGTWSLSRLDFGSSLLNTPTGVNLGNPGGILKHPRDLTIMKFCGETIGFAVNGAFGSSDIVKLDFRNNLASAPVITSLGNVGNLSFPHSIAQIFRVGADLYSFVTNVDNNTLTRLQFGGCNNSSIPNSALQNPPAVTYSTPGTYNINLTIDDGLPTQSTVCKQVIVLPDLEHKPIQNISVCNGNSVKIGSASKLGTYLWNTGSTSDSITINSDGIYWVETKRYGCTNRDSFFITVVPPFNVDLGADREICKGEEIVLNAGITADSYLWNTGGTTQSLVVSDRGTYYVTVEKNSCKATDTINVDVLPVENFDFSYKQDVCDPLTIQFNGNGNMTTGIYWDFGDGAGITGNINPEHTYTSPGNYLVKYDLANAKCGDTVQKLIKVDIFADNLILTADTTICYPSTKQLRTVPSLNFCWSPTTFLDNANSPNPVTSTPQDITYYFTAEVTGTNLVTNGDFSSGNTGFTSQYNFDNSNPVPGQYFIGADASAWHSIAANCGDHTTGNGNMMMVVPAPTPDMNIWQQKVTITPNTNYVFSAWLQTLTNSDAAQLQLSINGNEVGSLIKTNSTSCNWTWTNIYWNSGNNTVAEVSLLDKRIKIMGNIFSVDDISFAPVFMKRDSVKIKVEKPFIKTSSDTILCSGQTVLLNTTGAQTYSWSPATGLSNEAIANPVASPLIPTQYIVTGTTLNGCSAKDSVMISLYPKPIINISQDTTICKNSQVQLSVSGGSVYSWSPASGLDNPNSSNPVASPVVNTNYYVSIKDGNTCDYRDSILVHIRPDAVFSISAPGKICEHDSLQLSASGGDVYTWQAAEGLNNRAIANPMVFPLITTDYTVTITETTCNQSETLSTSVVVNPPPTVKAAKSNDIDCSNDQSLLNATGAAQFLWTPATALSNPNVNNPIATPTVTTKYTIKGTDAEGCTGYDTVIVKVENANKSGYLMPNAFTPNNDGMNDCFGVKYWGMVNEFEFSIYNRWGERIFFTKNATQCWDGTYKGVNQDGGVYVYMIKAKTSCEPEVFRKGTFVLVR